ncbi:hypothetical protein N7489_007816 [Penicillium chrysogenum]|uniref:Uncharacterized protein n=1 Tax=Penicillium chrysogenum TaxID=5076 RepID=A0ABQ8WB10_PENCH|nr:uncharacterized protein N7489_007816 [Penicillium chrysogenum]KAJ5237725.1 hypothetical protein N7489_007816 [Penicillium chrysogenum]KAJ5262014.1 hypothetical protein N7505_008881 [Penicillium chrysogenum]KAJ5278023.1 hypothetical protein N7524_004176 [Penicillium chrysogenum]KAJ6159943.1 hypothetical protein N7497_004480 [Penicillium chrysogenum]
MEPQTKDPDPLPRLVHIGDIQFNLGEVTTGGVTPRGNFIFCPITGGHFTTVFPLPDGFGIHSEAIEGLRAEVLPGGGDYPLIHNNELAELNVSVVAKGLNNDHIFRITSFGICEWNKLIFDMMGQTAAARSTEMGEINAWQVFRINTDSPEYAWLNWACIIGQERLIYEDGRMAKTHMKLFQFLVK